MWFWERRPISKCWNKGTCRSCAVHKSPSVHTRPLVESTLQKAPSRIQVRRFSSFSCACVLYRTSLPGDSGCVWAWGGGDLQPAVSRGDPGHHLQQVLSSRRRKRGCPSAGTGHPHRMDNLQQPWAVQRHAQDQSRVGLNWCFWQLPDTLTRSCSNCNCTSLVFIAVGGWQEMIHWGHFGWPKSNNCQAQCIIVFYFIFLRCFICIFSVKGRKC